MAAKYKIIKRTSIDNSIVRELIERYPLQCSKNGVAYKQKLDYLTFETDFLTEATMRDLRQVYKHTLITLIFFLRTKMCLNGWYTRVDGNYRKYLIEDAAKECGISKNKVAEILEAIINSGIFAVVSDKSIMDGQLLTCAQQIYNYEMAASNRKRGRGSDSNNETESYNRPTPPIPESLPFDEPANMVENNQPIAPPDGFYSEDEDPFGILNS